MYRIAYLLCLGIAIGCVVGCGGEKGPATTNVKGTVLLDNQPMAEGEISFEIIGEAPRTMPVKDGTFEGQAYRGNNRVAVYAYKDGPPLDTDPEGPPTRVNVIPERYNSATRLSAEVSPGGPNDFKFEITRR